MQEISFDPGIEGFVKGHRHPTGPSLVMSSWEEEERDWIGVFWVRRLAHNAKWVSGDLFGIVNERTIVAAERCYDYELSHGPPAEAVPDYQRRRVYDWEDAHICPVSNSPMTWEGCEYFLRYVWDRVGNGAQPLLTNNRRCGTAMSMGGSIHLPEDQEYWTKPILLHEIAHEMKPLAAHGPVFVSTYMRLAVRFLGLDIRRLRETATEFGVRFK